jgi:hypothetical protein
MAERKKKAKAVWEGENMLVRRLIREKLFAQTVRGSEKDAGRNREPTARVHQVAGVETRDWLL